MLVSRDAGSWGGWDVGKFWVGESLINLSELTETDHVHCLLQLSVA